MSATNLKILLFLCFTHISLNVSAISPDLLSEIAIVGAFDVATDQVSGGVIVYAIESGEVVTYDEMGSKLADCTAGLGLGNFSNTAFDASSFSSNSGSLVTQVSGSVITIVNFEADISNNAFIAVDCNNPQVNIQFQNDFQVRHAFSNLTAVGDRITSFSDGSLFPSPAVFDENIQDIDVSNLAFWTVLTGSISQNIFAGVAFNPSAGDDSAYLFGTGFIGDGAGFAKQIDPSPLDTNTLIFTDNGVDKYYLNNSATTGEFSGFDIKDSTDLGFLISNSSDCFIVEDQSDVLGSSSIGSTCEASESIGTLLYVISDGALKVFETAPLVIPPIDIECIDTDGDGWGWDGTSSCLIEDVVPVAGDCIDTDGDGFGWDGLATCTPAPQICIDTDGDGWGWDGSASCLITGSIDPIDDSVFDVLPCIDLDGDGWGWKEPPGRPDAGRSCVVL